MAVTADKVVVELELRDTQYTSRLKASEREFKRSMDVTERAAADAARDIKRTMGQLPDDLRAEYRGLGEDIGRSFAGASRAAQLAFGAITAYSLKLASDAQEIESAFGVAFGKSTESVKAFSEQLADTAGRDAVVLRESMTRLQLVLTGTGVAATDAAKMVEQLTAIGVDAGSLFNTSDAEALQKIISGLTGESEPLKAFGVVLTEAAVKAELLRLGFEGNAEAASEAAKSTARANLIIKGLAVAQGDAARTSDSAANTTKRMTAEFNKAARELGTQLLPAMTALFGATTDVLRAFNELPGGVQVAGLAFLGLIAAGGPIAGLLANLARVIKLAKETRAALILAGLGGAGAGGLAALGAGVGAGAATLSLGGSSNEQSTARRNNSLPADQQLRNAEAGLAALRRQTRPGQGRTAEQQARAIASAQANVDRLRRVAEIGRGIDELLGPGGAEDPGVIGGFTLPAGLRTGTSTGGGRTGGGASSAAQAEADARRRSRLEDEARLIAIRATGNEALIKAEEERQRLADLTAQYQEAGYADAVSRATEVLANENQIVILAEQKDRLEKEAQDRAERMRNERERALTAQQRQYDLELEIARARGDDVLVKSLEREAELRERIAAATEQYGPLLGAVTGFTQQRAVDAAREEGQIRSDADLAASTFVDALRSGDVWESLGQRFADAAANNLQQVLSQILQALASSNAGGNSFFGDALKFASTSFGGGRALGGPVRAGFSYDVGENGREKFVAPANGYIVPNMATANARSAGGGAMSVNINLAGANGDATIRRIATDAARVGTAQAISQSRQDTANDKRLSRYRMGR